MSAIDRFEQGPLGKAAARRVLYRIVAGRVTLGRIERRDPEVVARESSALAEAGLGIVERQRVRAGHEPVSLGWSRALHEEGLTIFQHRALNGSIRRCAAASVSSRVDRLANAFPHGFVSSIGRTFGVDLVDGVVHAVDVQIEPDV